MRVNNCPECKPSKLTVYGEKKLRDEIKRKNGVFNLIAGALITGKRKKALALAIGEVPDKD